MVIVCVRARSFVATQLACVALSRVGVSMQEGEALKKQLEQERAALEKEKAALAAEMARLQQQGQQQQHDQQRKPGFGLPFAFA